MCFWSVSPWDLWKTESELEISITSQVAIQINPSSLSGLISAKAESKSVEWTALNLEELAVGIGRIAKGLEIMQVDKKARVSIEDCRRHWLGWT